MLNLPPSILTVIVVSLTAVMSGASFWFLSKRRKGNMIIKVAIVNDKAYWQVDGQWYTAPVVVTGYTSEIDNESAEEINIDSASVEELQLLMEILERFES